MRGFKFLNQYCATDYDSKDWIYPVPGPGEKWGPWFEHPDPGDPDGKDCGAGGWHVMKRLDARHAPSNWWPWFAEGDGILGESDEKFRATRIRLRRIPKKVFWKIIRAGHCRDADLRNADLRDADLGGADLRNVDLRGANLGYADLRNANLWGANLGYADLGHADLGHADLRHADLWGANLRNADLWGADLRNADLRNANLWGAIGIERIE